MGASKATTARNKKRFLEVMRSNGYRVFDACKEVGITYRTLMNWRQNDAEFNTESRAFLEHDFEIARDTLVDHAMKGDKQAAIELYKTLGPKYGHDGQVVKTVKVDIGDLVNRLSPDQALAIVAAAGGMAAGVGASEDRDEQALQSDI